MRFLYRDPDDPAYLQMYDAEPHPYRLPRRVLSQPLAAENPRCADTHSPYLPQFLCVGPGPPGEPARRTPHPKERIMTEEQLDARRALQESMDLRD
ncbi:hypothetical protein [Flexivirga caeni]|uniref:hypothetical protein n=1 Tax=Flexivirga caeni TaxID=2294115 RepID=UPI0013150F9E|nr:hypothetical protein [Flexivirga caeni]